MKKLTTIIAIPIFALMLGACASTNDTADTRPEHTTESNNNPTEIPSATERQDEIAYTDISASANTKEVVTSETQVPVISSTVENPPAPLVTTGTTSTTISTMPDQTMTSSSTTVDNTATMSGTSTTSTTSTSVSSSGNNTTGSMTSSSSLNDDTTDDDDDDDDETTTSRTRMRKD